MRPWVVLLAMVVFQTVVQAGGFLTEAQARLKAAEWLRGPGFSADPRAKGEDRSITEILAHIMSGLLVVRGDTGYCGVIQEPTWILIFDHEASSWNGGNGEYPVLINARTGKVLDCRS